MTQASPWLADDEKAMPTAIAKLLNSIQRRKYFSKMHVMLAANKRNCQNIKMSDNKNGKH
ncbi:hypothetical protein [uncultured Nostoc sp.]|uniref:hypothetical protein n=1 Tax=uncultured Nostoc sp. TaxID=340711 RepID=UPI0035CA8695